jgi:hypothetical protein
MGPCYESESKVLDTDELSEEAGLRERLNRKKIERSEKLKTLL